MRYAVRCFKCELKPPKKWKPLNPKQKSHPSVRDIDDSTVIPDEQEVPEWCILCPRNKYLRDNTYAHTHY